MCVLARVTFAVLFILLLLLLLISSFDIKQQEQEALAQSTTMSNSPADDSTFSTYLNSTFGIKLQYLSNWEIKLFPISDNATIKQPIVGFSFSKCVDEIPDLCCIRPYDQCINIEISVRNVTQTMTKNITLASLVKERIDLLNEPPTGEYYITGIDKSELITLTGGNLGHKIVYSTSAGFGGFKSTVTEIYAIKDNKVYLITINQNGEQRQELPADVQNMIDSFEIVVNKGGGPSNNSSTIASIPFSETNIQQYSFVTKWGSEGRGDGQFINLGGIDVDSDGNVYVFDTGNSRIQKFSNNGTFITTWGSKGKGDGQFFIPPPEIQPGLPNTATADVVVDSSGNLYVADTGNGRIQKFDSNGKFITSWNADTCQPYGIDVDSSNNVYANCRGHIMKFTPTGNNISEIRLGNLGGFVSGFAVDPEGNIYATDWYSDIIRKYTSNGTEIDFPSNGEERISIYTVPENPGGLYVDSEGNIFATDDVYDDIRNKTVNLIKKFTTDGTLVSSFGSEGTGDGQFEGVLDIAVDSRTGYVYVSDSENNRIQVFAPATSNATTASRPSTTINNSVTSSDFLKYENSAYGVRTQYPSNWEKQEEPTGYVGGVFKPIVVFLIPQSEDEIGTMSPYQGTVGIAVANLRSFPQNVTTLKEYTYMFLNSLRPSLDHLIESTPTTFAGYAAHKIVYSDNLGFNVMAIFAIKNDKIYTVDYIADVGTKYSSNLPVVERMIDSFEILSSSNEIMRHKDKNLANSSNSVFALNYTYSHAMSGFFYKISYNSNTSELALLNNSGYKLYNTTITETSENKLKDIILQSNFFQTQSNGPSYIPDSTIEELSIILNGKEHKVEWGNSQDKETPENLLKIAESIKDVLCVSSPEDIVISSTLDFGPPDFDFCQGRST